MSGLQRVFDASTPPLAAPAGCAGVLGYVGRPGYTPHVWTPLEWGRFRALVQFPAYLPNIANHASLEAVDALIPLLKSAGWNGQDGPRAVVIDYETLGSAEAAWHAELADVLGQHGFDAIAYGSLSDVVQIEAAHVWAADWNNETDLAPAGMTVHAHQYRNAGALDYSVADEWLMGRGLRRA